MLHFKLKVNLGALRVGNHPRAAGEAPSQRRPGRTWRWPPAESQDEEIELVVAKIRRLGQGEALRKLDHGLSQAAAPIVIASPPGLDVVAG